MEWILVAFMGVALAAACGLRVFVPLLIVSIAAQAGYVTLSPNWTWLGSWPAAITFGLATVLEICAYYIPAVDNLLDAIATPAALVAGTIVAGAFITGVDPLLKWVLAAVVGGGAAGAVQAATVATRALSTAATGGLANPVVSTVEWIGSLFLSLLAIFVPLVAIAALVVSVTMVAPRLVRRKRPAPAGAAAT